MSWGLTINKSSLIVIGLSIPLFSYAFPQNQSNHSVKNETANSASKGNSHKTTKVIEQFGKVPLSFEVNNGQVDDAVAYFSISQTLH